VLALAIGAGPLGCRNPGQSTLPPSAIAPPGTPLPPLPKGDLYADETQVDPETPIEPGDTLEVLIHRGTGEEKYTSVVREAGRVHIDFLDVEVRGIPAAQAEARIQEAFVPYLRNPRVQVLLKKKSAKVKRIFVFGDVKKPGMFQMSRNMTVLQAIAMADNYNESAYLDEIRVVRGTLDKPQVLTADLARAFTYGDLSRNLSLEENDIVYVPRERLGDASAAGLKLGPLIYLAIYPFYALIAAQTINNFNK
jgi:polysaccharide export outer membrane protein